MYLQFSFCKCIVCGGGGVGERLVTLRKTLVLLRRWREFLLRKRGVSFFFLIFLISSFIATKLRKFISCSFFSPFELPAQKIFLMSFTASCITTGLSIWDAELYGLRIGTLYKTQF